MWQRFTGNRLLFWKRLSEDTVIPRTIAHSETEWGAVRPQPLFRGGRWATTGCWSLVLWDGLWRLAVAVKEVLLEEGQGDGGATWKPAAPSVSVSWSKQMKLRWNNESRLSVFRTIWSADMKWDSANGVRTCRKIPSPWTRDWLLLVFL